MRILINFEEEERGYLSTLVSLLKRHQIEALATSKNLSIIELIGGAEQAHCQAIFLLNTESLKSCVQANGKITLNKFQGTRLNFSIPAIVGTQLEQLRTLTYGKWLFEVYIEKLKAYKQPIVQFSFQICDTLESFLTLEEKAKQAEIIAFDIETIPEYPLIACIGFTFLTKKGELETFVVPLIDFQGPHYRDPLIEAEAISTIKNIMGTPVPKVAHNGIYDCQYLLYYNIIPRNWCLDTMGIAHSEYSELPKTLEFEANLHCHDYYYWKDDSSLARKQNNLYDFLGYCAKDTFYTMRVLLSQLKDLSSYTSINYQQNFPLVYPCLYTAFEGILIDQETKAKVGNKAKEALDSALQNLRLMTASNSFNPASTPQVAEFLYDIIGAKHPKAKRNTDEKTLIVLADQHPLIAIITEAIIKYREQAKALSTYIEVEDFFGRLLYNLNPFGTETSRMACKASNFWCGNQIQNQPAYAKEFLIADPGYVLIEADNNKSEARCVAYLAKSIAMIAALEDPEKDFYKNLATILFGWKYEDVTKELRNNVIKKIVHGRNYVMGDNTFVAVAGAKLLYRAAELLGIKITSLKQFAGYLLGLYDKPFPELKDYWYPRIKEDVTIRHRLINPFGYSRYFFADLRKTPQALKEAIAHEPQNLSVAILNKGFRKVYEQLVLTSNGDFRLKAQIHDSIFAQVKEEKVPYYMERMSELMDNPVEVHGRTLRIPVDFKVGYSWGDMLELECRR